jgi:pyridinium-3,5-bisthiocarboxylic acid mononucleotide nickel chelatase
VRIAYLDTISGIAGDMTMAAFVSAGLPIDELSTELKKLPLGGFELLGSHVQRSGIDAVHIEVVVSPGLHHHRHLGDIKVIIENSALSPAIRERATSVFAVLAEAEAKIHNTTPEKVHFHEVGAVDSIVDIVGTAICMEKFEIDRLYTSPIRLGSGGWIKTEHGTLPTPAPATLEILKNYPTILTSIPEELTTPTGAGIVKALSAGILAEEVIVPRAVGYGAGTKEVPGIPNLLRVVIGDLEGTRDQDDIVVVETNIDDMNPQLYPYVIEKLLASGAHDAYLIPIVMKKGRPGILLSVMVERLKLDSIITTIYSQTSTIGLRIQNIGRKKLPRRQIDVHTSLGTVRAKVVHRDTGDVVTAEFEECRRIAEKKQIPLVEVMRILEREIGSGA